MASIINGTNIVLYYYNPSTSTGIPFGSATSCTFNVSVSQKEVTSSTSAWFREYKNDVSEWNISCDGFIALSNYSYLFLANLQLSRASIIVKFQINNDNGGAEDLGYTVFTGTANLSSLSISAPVEGSSTYSVSLQGSGPYTISGTQVAPGSVVVKGSNVVMYDYVAVGGETTVTFTGAILLSLVSLTRGSMEVRGIGYSGTPTGENVVFNTTTGVITFARALAPDEFVRAIFK